MRFVQELKGECLIKNKNMKILAIIPARGGSKGVPRKNVLPLCGQPLIGYTIKAALKSKYSLRIVVSTDDNEIANVSRTYGAEVVMRPTAISTDSARSELAILHVLEYLKKNEAYNPDLVVFLQCTSPLTLPEDIDGTISALIENDADSAIAVAPFHYFIWKAKDNKEIIEVNHNKNFRPMRQEREPEYIETGAVVVMKTDGFLKSQHRFFGKTSYYIMPKERCLEIDDPIDFKIAEVIMKEQLKVK